MKNYKIRKAKAADLNWIVKSQMEMAFESEKLKLHLPTLRKGVQHILKNSQAGNYWIVTDSNGNNVGMCLCLYEWSDWRNRNILWVHSVWVEKEHRKKGIFKMLYGHLQTLVKKSSRLGGIRLYVDKKNVNAQQVYKNLEMNNEHYELFEWMK